EEAVDAGATVRLGGKAPDRPGFFYDATVLTDVAPDGPASTVEIFGPVAPITTFEDEEDALAWANATDAGLIAYVMGGELGRALAAAERLEAGMVAVNRGVISDPAAPFGGTKESGLGREGGFEGIEEYLEHKYIGASW